MELTYNKSWLKPKYQNKYVCPFSTGYTLFVHLTFVVNVCVPEWSAWEEREARQFPFSFFRWYFCQSGRKKWQKKEQRSVGGLICLHVSFLWRLNFLIVIYKGIGFIMTARVATAFHLKYVFIPTHIHNWLAGLVVWDQKRKEKIPRHEEHKGKKQWFAIIHTHIQ